MFDTIHHIAIIGSDYDKSKYFYVDLLGFEIIRENYRKERDDYKIDLACGEQEIELVMNHQFNWWFDYAPIRGLCLQRLKGGCLKHLYRPASKRGYLLVSSLFDSSFCC